MEQHGPPRGKAERAERTRVRGLFADFFDPLRGAGQIPAPRRGSLLHGGLPM